MAALVGHRSHRDLASGGWFCRRHVGLEVCHHRRRSSYGTTLNNRTVGCVDGSNGSAVLSRVSVFASFCSGPFFKSLAASSTSPNSLGLVLSGDLDRISDPLVGKCSLQHDCGRSVCNVCRHWLALLCARICQASIGPFVGRLDLAESFELSGHVGLYVGVVWLPTKSTSDLLVASFKVLESAHPTHGHYFRACRGCPAIRTSWSAGGASVAGRFSSGRVYLGGDFVLAKYGDVVEPGRNPGLPSGGDHSANIWLDSGDTGRSADVYLAGFANLESSEISLVGYAPDCPH